jgi:hypothetical protein
LWRSVWDLIRMPVVAVATGKVYGVAASRNPLHWISLWLYAVILIPLILVIYPLVVLGMMATGFWMIWVGRQMRISDAGVEVFSSRKGLLAAYNWGEIASLDEVFEPPFFVPKLKLASGDELIVELGNFKLLKPEFAARSIPVNELSHCPSSEDTGNDRPSRGDPQE